MLTAPTREASDSETDFDYTADEEKIREVVGERVEAYKVFYGQDWK